MAAVTVTDPGDASPLPSEIWVTAADEGMSFPLAAPQRVRYGAGGTWIERDQPAGAVSCTNAFFGADPLPGIVKRCEVRQDTSSSTPSPPTAGSWMAASNEWQVFTLASAGRVRYGGDGAWIERDLPPGPVSCSNAFFGSDPLPGVAKRCEVRVASWVFAADEWQDFALGAAGRVRYGVDSDWIERDLPAGSVSCTNAFFGADPRPGVAKRCEVRAASGSAAPVIASFAPTSGPAFTVVVVRGTGFGGVSGATIGGVAATFDIVSAAEVHVRVPSGAPTGRIVLTAGSAASVSLSDFTVTQPASVPTVTSVTPTTVSPGAQIVVTGTSLDDVAVARLGSTTLTIVSQSTTGLVLALPAGATSGMLVLVDRTGVARDAAAIQVLVPMVIAGFSPPVVERGQPLTITGQGLDRVATVRFVDADAPVASRSGSNVITVVVPAAASSGRVTLIASQGDQASSGTDVTIVDPVTATTQVHRVGVGGTVTVVGTGLERVGAVLLGTTPVGLASRSATTITFVVPGGVRCTDIALRLDDGRTVDAGSLITGADCGVRTAGVEFAQLLSQRTDDPRLRLAAGKETWVRSFVVSSDVGTQAPQVRVRATDAAGSLLGTLAMTGPADLPVLAEGQAVPESLRMDDGRTFRVELPASWIQPGLRLQVQAGESQEPSTIVDAAPVIVDSGGLRVVLVPLWSGPYGPAVPTAEQAHRLVVDRFPLAADRISVAVRAPYALTSVTGGVATSAQWSAVLSELESLRANEAPSTLYYGFVQPRVSSGVAGIGYVNNIGSRFPALASLGWDTSRSAWKQTMVHEVGHNFGRLHAPCGGVASSDPSFPYANGAIGPSPVFDPGNNVFGGVAGQYDVMGYCNGSFFSDYNLSGVKAFLEARPASMKTVANAVDKAALEKAALDKASATSTWLSIGGTIDADGARVRHVRAVSGAIESHAHRPASVGAMSLRLVPRVGSSVEHAIEPVAVDHIDDEQHFTLLVPSPGPLRRIEVIRDGRVIHARDAAPAVADARAKVALGSSAAAVRATDAGWVMTWDAARYPHASLTFVIGDSRRVLAIDAAGGRWTIPATAVRDLPPDGRLELSLSDGVDAMFLQLARP